MAREIFFGGGKTFGEIFRTHAALLISATVLLYISSTSTSPLYLSFGNDSAIFQAVGRCWSEGLIPYVDAFENKGALIFAIDAIGYLIAPRTGIFLLQIPAMYLSMLLAWRSLSLYLSGRTKIFASVFMIIFYTIYSIDGNRTEEWSMSFLMASTYFFLRGFQFEDGKFFCPPVVGLINGIGFGACVFLRAMNAMPLCCYVFLTAIFLLRDREFKTLLRNGLMFVIGALLVSLPFVIYFAAHGALYEMFYGTILLNIMYTGQRENFLLTHLNEFTDYMLIYFMPLILMIVFGAVEFVRNKNRLTVSIIFTAVVMLIMFMRLSLYSGYYALITPLFPVFFAAIIPLAKKIRAVLSDSVHPIKRILCKILIVTIAIYPITLFCGVSDLIIENNSDFIRQYHQTVKSEFLRLKEVIPPNERNSVMAWSEGMQISKFILTTGILPANRFFSNVKAFSDIDPNVKREWFTVARDNSVKWIVYCFHNGESNGNYEDDWVKYFRRNRDIDVERFLTERYNLSAETELYYSTFKLYRLKD
ncbi:MAG: hypothetical protein K6G55_06990 [Selenomonadaceae bacterium]|nr:hypothetical protein [Selenomonadaceae bacterium]